MAKGTERTDIGHRLVELRKKINKTQNGIADAIKIKRDTYARYETDTELPLTILKKLCELYNVTSDYIIFGNENHTYNIDNVSPTHLLRIGTKINYNKNIASNDLSLSEDEIELIKLYRELPDSKKDYLKKNIVDIGKI